MFWSRCASWLDLVSYSHILLSLNFHLLVFVLPFFNSPFSASPFSFCCSFMESNKSYLSLLTICQLSIIMKFQCFRWGTGCVVSGVVWMEGTSILHGSQAICWWVATFFALCLVTLKSARWWSDNGIGVALVCHLKIITSMVITILSCIAPKRSGRSENLNYTLGCLEDDTKPSGQVGWMTWFFVHWHTKTCTSPGTAVTGCMTSVSNFSSTLIGAVIFFKDTVSRFSQFCRVIVLTFVSFFPAP